MVSRVPIIADLADLPAPPGGEEEEEKASSPVTHVTRPEGAELQGFDWRTKFRTDMVAQVEKWADALGTSKFALDALVRDHMDGALNYITRAVFMPNTRRSTSFDTEEGVGTVNPTSMWRPDTPQDWEQVWNAGLLYFSAQAGVDLASIGSGSGRGRRGARGPSAQDIRNMFDEEQLTDAVQSMWGAYLLEDTKEARKIAKNYIEAHVSSGGQKEIDFETYVKGRMEGTPRWKQIYQNKPEGVDALQYIGPYVAMTSNMIGGGSGNKQLQGDLVAGGAALGASQDAFANRLKRTDQHTASSGFINGIENKVRSVANILRG